MYHISCVNELPQHATLSHSWLTPCGAIDTDTLTAVLTTVEMCGACSREYKYAVNFQIYDRVVFEGALLYRSPS